MPRIRKTTRPYGYKTISVRSATPDGISVLHLRQLLGIQTRDTINAHLKTLGYFSASREEKLLGWEQVRDVLGLHLWLRVGIEKALGKRIHTRRTYKALVDAGLAEQALAREGIDLEQQFQEFKHEYQQRNQRQAAS